MAGGFGEAGRGVGGVAVEVAEGGLGGFFGGGGEVGLDG